MVYFLFHRIGFARLAESTIRKIRGKAENDKLGAADKILASTIGELFTLCSIIYTFDIFQGGALGTWNQPIEVVRVEVSLILLC